MYIYVSFYQKKKISHAGKTNQMSTYVVDDSFIIKWFCFRCHFNIVLYIVCQGLWV